MMLIDTHCHLYLPKFKDDLEQLVQRSADNHVSKIFLPAIDSESHTSLIELADRKFDSVEIYPMMGLHPCSVQPGFEKELDIIRQYLDSGKKFYAVGEIGLDYYWDTTHKDLQIAAFERQIEWSIEKNLPINIHSRNSTADSIKSVAKYAGKAKGIFHCFGGTLEEAQQIMELGFYMGIGGVVTYKNSGLDAIVKQIGLSHVVLETDAPYLTPVPHRGKRNEPSYIRIIAERLAEVMNMPLAEVAEITTANALKVFQLV